MDPILRRLLENKKNDNKLEIEINDPEGSIRGLLKIISDYSRQGHSFTVVVDPGDEERRKEFWIDGDGSDKLYLD